ncbi:MAG TPA: prolyl oligopeptidase family serine peptidase [Candidatus Binataceae bacterium]|nr:prolyl oligopeptidase family serine peptidase [Candidatus Binataceae bacterium]
MRKIGVRTAQAFAILALTAIVSACRVGPKSFLEKHPGTAAFNYRVALGPNQYRIAGYLTRSRLPGRLPAMLVLNGEETAERCVDSNAYVVAMGIQVACVSIPGYGHSSGPSRYVGPQAVAAARRALDLLAARPDVDPARIAVWGLGNGAVAAGLLMDYDSRPRALILQSGAYDMLALWPETTLRTKLAILHEVWPSKRVLAERSVIRHLPDRLGCSVLILHGKRDRAAPVSQAEDLASALRERGAHVETHYFAQGHRLDNRVSPDLRAFLRENLLGGDNATAAAS